MQTITAAEMKQAEQQADARGLRFRDMMYNAGAAACRAVQAQAPDAKLVAVFAGPGNNGGDGYVAAGLLAAMGASVMVVQVGGHPRSEVSAQQLAGLQRFHVPVCPLYGLNAIQIRFIRDADVVIDAVYGTGFHGELTGEAREAADMIASCRGQVWAMDIPTGLECDSGRAAEGTVKADVTLAFHMAKPAHVLPQSAPLCGDVQVVDIGITAALQAPVQP